MSRLTVAALSLPARRALGWGAGLFLLWTLLGLFEAAQNWSLIQLLQRDVTPEQCVLLALANWYGLGLLAPVMWWLARLYPLGQRRWDWPVAVPLAASVGLALLKVALDVPCERLIRPDWEPFKDKSDLELLQILFGARFLFYLLVFWLVLGVAQAVLLYRRFRERAVRAAQLEAKLAVAQLQVLKTQLQPHFLFNTLNAISALIHQDVELADRMIARLGELLRQALDTAGTQEVTLRQELEFIKPYLEIEQARLGPRLDVAIDVDAEVIDASVPNLILQPLVENAIRHGVAPRRGPGRIAITARRQDGALLLQVRDNGGGLAANYTEGVGVSNTRARLRQLYGDDQRFVMTVPPEGGLLVTVAVPFREEPGQPVEGMGGGQ
jgi:two-component sensor histidine kinase